MTGSWKTPYGPRRVRNDPPTLEEAIIAATGLTDDINGQVEIAASLMNLPPDEVRPSVLKAVAQSRGATTVVAKGRAGVERSVVVERKPSRRVVPNKITLSRPVR